MKIHQIIFDKTRNLLKRHLGDKLNVDIEKQDDGYEETHLTITDTDVWISCDDREITIGSGFNHRHYNPEFDNINDIIEDLFDLLTQRKRITEYYKGKTCYKKKTEIEIEKSKYKELSTSLTWLFPFWKHTKEKVFYEDKLIDETDIIAEIEEIKNYAQQSVKMH